MVKTTKVYTEQQQLFLDALAPCGGKIRAAMTVAGFSKDTSERYIINILHEEIVEIANKLLAASAVQAACALTEVLDNPENLGNAHKINASKEILDRGGVIKKSTDDLSTGKNTGGILILPAKKMKVTVESED